VKEELHAVILAGGRQTRMGPGATPKCLTPVGGVPIIFRSIHHLQAQGVSSISVCVGWKAAEVVREVSKLDGKIGFLDAGAGASMMERLKDAVRAMPDGRLLVCYGDEFADVNVEQLVKKHEDSGAQLTITCVSERLEFGIVHADGGPVWFDEKPEVLVNVGYQVWERHMVAGDTFTRVFREAGDRHALGVYRHFGRRITVNRPEDIPKSEEALR
jgi:NDP-sugar pyrophosphorylase family protein